MKSEFHRTEAILKLVVDAINDGVTAFTLPSGRKSRVTRKMKAFHFHGTKCSKCGLEGMFFRESIEGGTVDLNLFGMADAENEQGIRLIMLTTDHIVPLSKGGGNHQENLQVMCKECNGEKGSHLEKRLEFGFLFRSVRDCVMARYPRTEKRDRFLAEFKAQMKPYRIPKTNSVLCGSKRAVKQYLDYVCGKYGYRVPLKKIKVVYKPEKQDRYDDAPSGHEIVVFLPYEDENESDPAYISDGYTVLSDGDADRGCERTVVESVFI